MGHGLEPGITEVMKPTPSPLSLSDDALLMLLLDAARWP